MIKIEGSIFFLFDLELIRMKSSIFFYLGYFPNKLSIIPKQISSINSIRSTQKEDGVIRVERKGTERRWWRRRWEDWGGRRWWLEVRWSGWMGGRCATRSSWSATWCPIAPSSSPASWTTGGRPPTGSPPMAVLPTSPSSPPTSGTPSFRSNPLLLFMLVFCYSLSRVDF